MGRAVILSLASMADDDEGYVALPADIKDGVGSVIERVFLSTRRPTTVIVPDNLYSASKPEARTNLTMGYRSWSSTLPRDAAGM
ncbi:hypothetical protein [Caballeronia grimmiae]|uniref:hypothetical protein n=1 Tax=Caballeronia grimmiae TaxID=1071679 RepID=UPI0038BB367B